MPRIFHCLVLATTLAPILSGASAHAPDANQSDSFKLTIAAHTDMDIQGTKQVIDADTEVHYTWERRDSAWTLVFDSVLVKASRDGNQVMNTFMSRAKLTNTVEGKTEEWPLEKAPDQLKKMLQDSFGVPICLLQVDGNLTEVNRKIVAGPGAKEFIDQGMIANARLFHAPFMRARDEWVATAEISMGNGGFATGELMYKKPAAENGGQTVKVSGTLTSEGFNMPGTQLAIRKARYVVNGEQAYNPAQSAWVSGRLAIDVSYEIVTGDKPVASAKGTMVLSLDKLGPGNR